MYIIYIYTYSCVCITTEEQASPYCILLRRLENARQVNKTRIHICIHVYTVYTHIYICIYIYIGVYVDISPDASFSGGWRMRVR